MRIVIPSHNRARRVITKRLIVDPIICVASSQSEAYRDHNAGIEIVEHPDEIIGLSMKRQWIYDKFGDVFMIDDDIKCLNDMSLEPGEPSTIGDKKTVTNIIMSLYEMAKALNIHLFGKYLL